MAATFVKCTSFIAVANPVTSSVTATPGNTLIAIGVNFDMTTGGGTFSGGGTWVNNANFHPTVSGGARGLSVASCASTTGGTFTFSWDAGFAAGGCAFVYEFSGMNTSSLFEGAGSSNAGSGSPISTSALTNTNPDAVMLAFAGTNSGSTETFGAPSNSWTTPTNGSLGDASFTTGVTAYKIVATSASQSTSWTLSPGDDWGSGIVTYKAVSTGATNTRTATPVTVALSAVVTRTATPVTVATSLAGQHAAPVADRSIGNWTTQVGGTTNLYATVDETTADDADYVQSGQAPTGLASYRLLENQQYSQLEAQTYAELRSSSDQLVLDLATLTTPVSGNRVLHYRYSKDAGTERIDLVVELLEGTSSPTVVQSWTHTDISTTWTQADQLVTGTITNYADLHVRLTASQV